MLLYLGHVAQIGLVDALLLVGRHDLDVLSSVARQHLLGLLLAAASLALLLRLLLLQLEVGGGLRPASFFAPLARTAPLLAAI